MITCAVYGCNNNTLTNADSAIQYYYFPKHPAVIQQWINACMWRVDQIDVNTARICSIHFDADSYANEYKMIDYLGCYTKMLKYDAVPTLYLPQPVIIKASFEANNEHAQAEPSALKNIIVYNVTGDEQAYTTGIEYIEDKAFPESNPLENHAVEDSAARTNLTEEEALQLNTINTHKDFNDLKLQNTILKSTLAAAQAEYEGIKARLEGKLEAHKAKDTELQKCLKKYYAADNQSKSVDEQIRILSRVFSESQIKILSGKKKIYWSNDDMAMGYTIRHMSNKRCYMYLSKKLNVPLPALSSIKRWVTLKKAEFDKVQKKENDVKEEEQESD